MLRCVLEVGWLRTIVLPVPVDGFEVFEKLDKALGLCSVASAFPLFDVLGWGVGVFTICEDIEILVDISELATFLNKVSIASITI